MSIKSLQVVSEKQNLGLATLDVLLNEKGEGQSRFDQDILRAGAVEFFHTAL